MVGYEKTCDEVPVLFLLHYYSFECINMHCTALFRTYWSMVGTGNHSPFPLYHYDLVPYLTTMVHQTNLGHLGLGELGSLPHDILLLSSLFDCGALTLLSPMFVEDLIALIDNSSTYLSVLQVTFASFSLPPPILTLRGHDCILCIGLYNYA